MGKLEAEWGAFLTNLARLLELALVHNVDTAECEEKAQRTSWSQTVQEQGDCDVIGGGLIKLNRERLACRATD